ncbi:MAG TPA: hypothetical protein VF624_12500 [Tepidisphaeraceae bacterium]|jgi:hypothetical protein
MHTAAKPAASPYAVARPAGKCAATDRVIAAGEKFMAVLRETPAGMERVDYAIEAWPNVDTAGALAYWQSVMGEPGEQKRKMFVDDEVLCTLFERLSDATEPNKLSFRFVLGLILMRKRLLVYEGSETVHGVDRWVVRFKGRDDKLPLANPHLDDEQVKNVSTQLGDIINEEL